MLISRDKVEIIGFLIILLAFTFSLSCLGGCGGGEGGKENSKASSETSENEGTWEGVPIIQIDAGGMLSPRIKAAQDSNGDIHLIYFQDSNDTGYEVRYLVINKQEELSLSQPLSQQAEPESIIRIDNCSALALALDQESTPVLAYRGGMIRECGREQQSDAMLSLKGEQAWVEYTGAIGVVERNPFFRDGLAGTEVSLALDDLGNIHLAYQFFYEGCDAMNYLYPDLCYVRKDRSSLAEEVFEETVEGNDYEDDNLQNSVGYHCAIVLDEEGDPAIFYYAELPDHTKGLRVARKKNGVWEKGWIETGCEVGFISCARCDEGGYLGVAYYVKQFVDGRDTVHCLRYAKEQSSSWSIQMVDDTVQGGDYCSLAYVGSGGSGGPEEAGEPGSPAIAYYEIKSHSGYTLNNLKIARLQGSTWEREVVAPSGDIGLYNTLWFDDQGRPMICTYSQTEKMVFLFSPAETQRCRE